MARLFDKLCGDLELQAAATPANSATVQSKSSKRSESSSALNIPQQRAAPCRATIQSDHLETLADTDLRAVVLRRFDESSRRLALNPAKVLAQFDAWAYSGSELVEMASWDQTTVQSHCELLASEFDRTIKP